MIGKSFPGIVNGTYDFSLSDMVITDERKESVGFSIPYPGTELLLMARAADLAAPAFAQSGDGFILWSDGSFDYFDKLAGLDKGLVHVYDDGAKVHTIVVESYAIPWLLVPEPEDGMHFDFSTLKK